MSHRTLRLFCLCFVFLFPSFHSVSAAILDSGFGNDGRVAVELGVYGDRANAVVVQPDGKIVVAGSTSNTSDLDFMLFRLLADGSLDPEFNYEGTVITSIGPSDDEVLALVLQDDGRIIAAGYSRNSTDRDFALVRYNSDGSLDHTFGQEGVVVTPVGNSDDEITGLVLQDDGAIIVTGSAMGTAGRVIVLGRYLAEGTLDTGFGDDGFTFTGVGEEAQAESVALLDDQRIVVSGSYSDGDRTGLMVVGFSPDGQLDDTFGENGIAVPTDDQAFSEGYGMTIRGNGSILVAGSTGEDGRRDAALFQFTANGEPDSSFEDNGVLVTSVSAEDDVLYDVVATDSGIAATGFTTVGNSKEFLFIVYQDAMISQLPTSGEQDFSGESGLRISALRIEESFDGYQAEQDSPELMVDVLTTGFSADDDIATALAEVEGSGFIAVGVSSQGETSGAAVSKYVDTTTEINIAPLSTGHTQIITGQPYDVTRTTAIIPVEILSGLGAVTERGVVFSTLPNPVLKDDGGDGGDDGGGGDGGDDTTAPVMSEPKAEVNTDGTVVISLTTDENATCKYNKDTDVAYGSMGDTFDGAGTTSHSKDLGVLQADTYTYYARCVDIAGNENPSGTKITFTVESGSATVLNKTMQAVADLFVATAVAADDTGSDTGDTSSTNPFDPDTEDFLEEGSTREGSGAGTFNSRLENLKPGTFFYVRAYAVVGGTTYYGNQQGFRSSDSCFIATAAFGSIAHPSVRLLREFRDTFMLNNHPGRSLVTLYYRYSPNIADVIATDSRLRFITRILLLPIVGAAWIAMQLGLDGLLGLLILALTGGLCWYMLNRFGMRYRST